MKICKIVSISVIQLLECIGLFGKNCTSKCNTGYYGHGCRYKCNCTKQLPICDSKDGCIEIGATYGESIQFPEELRFDVLKIM